jgi:hypothetical protein
VGNRAVHPGNTQILQTRTFGPDSAVDWSRRWINAPSVRPARSVPNLPPRPLRPARTSGRVRISRAMSRVPPKLHVVRFSLAPPPTTAPKPGPQPGDTAKATASWNTGPATGRVTAAAAEVITKPKPSLRRSAAAVKQRLSQHGIVLLHGRLAGKGLPRPALQYAPLVSQLLGRAPPAR